MGVESVLGEPRRTGRPDLHGEKRYLLCRPQGGLNDQLTQIGLCCRYADATDRTVIVDTNFKFATTFHDEFSRYFRSRQANLILSTRGLALDLDTLTTVPTSIEGRVSRYKPVYDTETRRFLDMLTRQPISFDMQRDHPQALLVHHQFGLIGHSLSALQRLTLTDLMADELLARLKRVDGPYVGVHIRHTDYRSRYRAGLRRLKKSPIERIFVATDSQAVLNEFIAELGTKRVISFSRAISTDGRPIHHEQLADDATFARNRDAILDLLMLALSSELVLFELEPNKSGTRHSGFSILAKQLQAAKPTLAALLASSAALSGSFRVPEESATQASSAYEKTDGGISFSPPER
jgi:hypothetical protein